MGSDRSHIELSRRAIRDLRAIPRDRRERVILPRLNALAAIPPSENLDVRPLVGCAPWQRLRAGNFRILFRRLTRAELDLLALRRGTVRGDTGFLIERIVRRSELERAVDTLKSIEP
jgi:mRNA-degrading endonuclease RelE of RelBE toxin-antitoxin system